MLMAALQQPSNLTEKLVLMGVSGCGKSSIGVALAHAMQTNYLDGDTLHPDHNIAKMQSGIPLTDQDRWPWLTAVATALHSETVTLVGCSALKKIYRNHLRSIAATPLLFIYLAGTPELIRSRMQHRTGHFMPINLLISQFNLLEVPDSSENAIHIPIDSPIPEIVDSILDQLANRNISDSNRFI